jgi:hypothetical protein
MFLNLMSIVSKLLAQSHRLLKPLKGLNRLCKGAMNWAVLFMKKTADNAEMNRPIDVMLALLSFAPHACVTETAQCFQVVPYCSQEWRVLRVKSSIHYLVLT